MKIQITYQSTKDIIHVHQISEQPEPAMWLTFPKG
jgi:hypothetical protein